MKSIEGKMDHEQKRLNTIDSSIWAWRMIMFYNQFGGREYSVVLSFVPEPIPLIESYRDLYNMGVNYQIFYKVNESSEDVYYEKHEIPNYLPFLHIYKYCLLISSKLQSIHRYLEHPSVQKYMTGIGQADLTYSC